METKFVKLIYHQLKKYIKGIEGLFSAYPLEQIKSTYHTQVLCNVITSFVSRLIVKSTLGLSFPLLLF